MGLQEAVEAVAQSVFAAATESLLPRGLAPAPQVFVFNRLDPKPLIGEITCRPYQAGHDAALAIAELGQIAAAVSGTDLLVFWEEFDLRTALWGPSVDHPNGFVLLHVSDWGHDLTWFPFQSTVQGWDSTGLPHIQIDRGEPSGPARDAVLPTPMQQLCDRWRTAMVSLNFQDSQRIVTRAAQDGYDIAIVH